MESRVLNLDDAVNSSEDFDHVAAFSFPLLFATEKNALEALIAAERSGARVYTLGPLNPDQAVKFLVMGCQGSGKKSQEEATSLMNQVAEGNPKPAFILFLGDNLYDYGPTTARDREFNTFFYRKYASHTFKNLRGLPAFLLLGNHDGNFHRKSFLSNHPVGRKTEILEISHSYLPDGYYLSVEEKEYLYSHDYLNLKTLPKWNMPHFFYALIINDTQIFVLDSNTYAKDYLAYLENKDVLAEENQAKWLAEEYQRAKAAGRRIIIAQHHPLVTSGKRAFPKDFDTHYYLKPDEIQSLNQYLNTNTGSYNEILRLIRNHQHIHADLELAAHDHCMAYYNNFLDTQTNDKICQLISGGGGQDLQNRESFLEHPYCACHLKANGCATVLIDPSRDDFEIEIFTTLSHQLKYTTKNHFALTQNHQDSFLEFFRGEALTLCAEHYDKFKSEQLRRQQERRGSDSYFQTGLNLFSTGITKIKSSIYPHSDREKEISIIDDLYAYLNQPHLPDLRDCIYYINELIQNLPEKDSPTSFYHKITTHLMNKDLLYERFGVMMHSNNQFF